MVSPVVVIHPNYESLSPNLLRQETRELEHLIKDRIQRLGNDLRLEDLLFVGQEEHHCKGVTVGVASLLW